jgi:hypothetical protein
VSESVAFESQSADEQTANGLRSCHAPKWLVSRHLGKAAPEIRRFPFPLQGSELRLIERVRLQSLPGCPISAYEV